MLLEALLLCPPYHSPMATGCPSPAAGIFQSRETLLPWGPWSGSCSSCPPPPEAETGSSCPALPLVPVCSAPAQLSRLELCPCLGKGSSCPACVLQLRSAHHLSPTWAPAVLAHSINNTSALEASFCLGVHSATCSASGAISFFLCLCDSLIHFTSSTWWMFSPSG